MADPVTRVLLMLAHEAARVGLREIAWCDGGPVPHTSAKITARR